MVIFLLIVSIPTFGQTAKDLERKYGKIIEAIEIRSGIMMRLQTGSSGQVAELRVEPYSGTGESPQVRRTMDADLVKEIIDELAPVQARGKPGADFGWIEVRSGSWNTYYNYEFVSIRLIHRIRIEKTAALPSKSEMDNEAKSAEVILIKWKYR